VIEPPFQIRPARDDDRLPLALVFAAVAEERDGIGTEPPVDVEARAASWTLDGTIVAVADGEVIGSIHVAPSSHGYGEIGMAIAREWRGRGVGSALMAAAIDWARARGDLHKLSLGVFAHNAAGSRSIASTGSSRKGAASSTIVARAASSGTRSTWGSCSSGSTTDSRRNLEELRAQRRASSNRGSSRTAAKSSSARACSRNRGNSSTDRRRWPNVSSPVSPASVAKHAKL
jgi:GNAT superfamily N-acetyltransferase